MITPTTDQQLAVQRLYAFMKQLAQAACTPEFIQNKAFDYALSLPAV